jgi:LacI family transcriptional regulator
VTIRDVAVRAGVSPMTVSRVINLEPSVRSATRERVHAAIRELNYAPSPAARSLAGAGAQRIALLYDGRSLPYLGGLLLGALDESRRTGTQLMVERCDATQSPRSVLDGLLQGAVGGVLLLPPLCEAAAVIEAVVQSGVAMVAVAGAAASERLATVRIDDVAAARALTDYLLALGHRRFGFIQGHPDHAVSELRLRGFLSALSAAGIGRAQVRLERGDFGYRSGLEAAGRLLAAAPLPTAIFAANDEMAAASASQAQRMGLNVPEDVSIVGFDDTPLATSVWPALTTVHQPLAAMARSAVELVLHEMRRRRQGGGKPGQLLHAHSLVVRGSSGPASS